MKKSHLTFTMLLVLTISLYAQIEVNEYGNTGIGATPNSTEKLYVKSANSIFTVGDGGATFKPNTSLKLYVGSYMGEPSIWPQYDYCSHIGTSSKAFWYIYGIYIYANGVNITSDARLKENIKNLDSHLKRLKECGV